MAHDRSARLLEADLSFVAGFWAKVDRRGPDECWPWLACLSRGYGVFSPRHGLTMRAHRYAYALKHGAAPAGLVLDHLCRNRACVNPAHLEPVTIGENVLRGQTLTAQNAAKTHCQNGHEFTVANTYVSAQGWRYCRACGAAKARIRKARKRAAA